MIKTTRYKYYEDKVFLYTKKNCYKPLKSAGRPTHLISFSQILQRMRTTSSVEPFSTWHATVHVQYDIIFIVLTLQKALYITLLKDI